MKSLDSEHELEGRLSTIRDLITALVRIRNKTKAHGAVGLKFFTECNRSYTTIVEKLVENYPTFQWKWFYVTQQEKRTRVVYLLGNNPTNPDISPSYFTLKESGLYFLPEKSTKLYSCSDLLISDNECSDFFFPNGNMNSQGDVEFINYASGKTEKVNAAGYSTPPPPLPKSETEGLNSLEIQSNVFGNLPPIPQGYVERRELQEQLETRLLDRNHAIITLHGRGG